MQANFQGFLNNIFAKKMIFSTCIIFSFCSGLVSAEASQMPKRLNQQIIKEKLSFSTGFNFSQSDYYVDGTAVDETTDINSLSFRVKYGRGDWNVSAQIPYIYVTGPASVLTTDDGLSDDFNISQVDKKRWGFGNLRLGAQYKFPVIKLRSNQLGSNIPFSFIGKYFDSVGFHIGTSIKAPTASEKDQLSSGEIDYSVYSGTFLRSGRWVANARLGYQMMGDTKETNYNNRWFSSFGGYYVLSKVHSIGLSYFFKQASAGSREPLRNLSTSFNWRLPRGWRLGMYLGTGLSRSSADISSGINITKTFVRKRRQPVNAELLQEKEQVK